MLPAMMRARYMAILQYRYLNNMAICGGHMMGSPGRACLWLAALHRTAAGSRVVLIELVACAKGFSSLLFSCGALNTAGLDPRSMVPGTTVSNACTSVLDVCRGETCKVTKNVFLSVSSIFFPTLPSWIAQGV
jgi:hypothetical protein